MDREIRNWWSTVPYITKWLFASMAIVTVASGMNIFKPYYLILDWPSTFKQLQIWRPFTATAHLGPLNFSFLIHLVFLYRYSCSLEIGSYAGRTADYLYACIICAVLNIVSAFFMGYRITGSMLIMSIIYIWSRYNADTIVSFFFGIKFKGVYLPWAMMAISFLSGGGHFPFDEFLGCISAHVYYYVNDVYPRVHGTTSYLKTPSFLKNVLPAEIQEQQRAREAEERRAQRPGTRAQGGYNWGTGHALG
ncbi:hypothetical protein CYY_004421 [Polysphondylium violaceum]|uniref:Derlin n=1 Tax=Polysphondylium violaceum TaxID=133409 RepID=A0A8J4PUN1_9MYCE|nr:hypothetical protein CYY_004421 [Polysphondylium violaceum]